MVRWNIEPRDLDVSWRTGGSRLAATPDELLALLGESTTAEYSESQLDLAEQQLERTEEATLKEALQNLREWVVLTVEYYRFKKSTFDPATAEYTKTQKSLSTLREQAAGVKSDIEMLGERVESLKLAYEKSVRVKNDQQTQVETIEKRLTIALNFLAALRVSFLLFQSASLGSHGSILHGLTTCALRWWDRLG
eukprot:m.167873 g.167873  ORF g.167873 m.167873 type:complete len:194 (+) comp24109_c0_seq6:6900-7481(+)